MGVSGVALASLILVPGTQFTGRVLGPDGKPVANATVSAYAREDARAEAERWVAGRLRVPLTKTSPAVDGTFQIEGDGRIAFLEAVADGHTPALMAALDDMPVVLTLRRALLRRGVVSAKRKPVAGAVVVWRSSDGAELITRTQGDGSYEAPVPASSPATLLVLHPDFAPHRASWRNDRREPALDRELEVGITLTGSVVDDASTRPVPGAALSIDGLPQGRSDASGAFRIAHVPQGWRTVTGRSGRSIGNARRQVGPLVIRLKALATLAGTVRDQQSGQPLAGATVAVGPLGSEEVEAGTDARGQYVVDGLPPGRYWAQARRPGFASDPLRPAAAPPINLRSTASARRDFALPRLPRVTGWVGDERRRPIEGALVTLGFRDTPHLYGGPGLMVKLEEPQDPISTRTTADGSFSLIVEPPGDAADSMWKDRPLVVLKVGYAAGRVELKDGRAASPILVRLTPGLELRGRVTAADGTPVAGVAVSLAEDGAFGGIVPIHEVIARSRDEGWTRSDAAGRFSIRVHPSVHHLAFFKRGYAPKTVRGHDPRAGQPLEVVLEPPAVVRGRVARPDGQGVAGVRVTVTEPASMVSEAGTADTDGAFEISDLSPGAHELVVTNEVQQTLASRMVDAPATDVQVVLPPSGALRGRVLDAATRQPVPRYWIGLLLRSGSIPPNPVRTIEDPAGAFALADVPVGAIGLLVNAEGYGAKRVDALSVISDAESPELEIALQAEAVIRGRVTSDGRTGVPEAEIRARSKVGATQPRVSSDEDGMYELRGVVPGEIRLDFSAQGFLPEVRTIDTRRATLLDVTLRRGLSLGGDVVHAGAAVADAWVVAKPSGPGARDQTSYSDQNGRFTLQGLVPGRYEVSASAHGKGHAKVQDVDVERAGSLRLVLDRTPTAVLIGKIVGSPPASSIIMVVVTAGEGHSTEISADQSHSFRIEDLPAGPVTVRAYTVVSGVPHHSRTVELRLREGLETATSLEFSGDVLRGLVVRDGAPVSDVFVSFQTGSEEISAARTDVRGAYEVVGLQPGRYEVWVTNQRDEPFRTEHVVTGPGQFDIDITGGEVSGRAVLADGGAPVEGVRVSCFRVGDPASVSSTLTDTHGAFSHRPLREGRYRLIASKADFAPVVRDVEVVQGGAGDVVLELSPAEGVSLTVFDARDGRPLDPVVVVRDAARRIVVAGHSGAGDDGVSNVPLAAGSYWLSASARGYGTVTLLVQAPRRGLRVGLAPGGTLVIESDERRGRIRLVQPDGEEYVRCLRDRNGIVDIRLEGPRTTVENVPPGSYTVELVGAEGVPSRLVVIREGQTTQVTID